MPSRSLVLSILALCAMSAFGQSRPDSTKGDSAAERRIRILDPGVSLGRTTFQFPPSIVAGLPFLGDRLLLPGETPLDRIPFTAGMEGTHVDLTLPLRLQMAKEDSWGGVRMTLSAAGAGAAAYLAYEHIRKYGLFK